MHEQKWEPTGSHFLFQNHTISQSREYPLLLLLRSQDVQLTVADLEVPCLALERALDVHSSCEEPVRHLTGLALHLDERCADSVVHTNAHVARSVLIRDSTNDVCKRDGDVQFAGHSVEDLTELATLQRVLRFTVVEADAQFNGYRLPDDVLDVDRHRVCVWQVQLTQRALVVQ